MSVTVHDDRARASSAALRAAAVVVVFFAAQKFLLFGAKGYLVRAPQDFASYYLAAKAFLRGLNPYDTERIWATFGFDAGVFHPFLYPPSSLLAVLPLTILPPRAAGLVFLVVSAAVLGVALYCFARIFFDRRWSIVLGIAGFAFQPITSTFLIGQINSIVLAVTALAIYAWHERRQTMAALLVAIGVALKLTPVFLILFFLVRREYAIVAKTLAWLAVALVVSVAVFGWDLHRDYLLHFSRTGPGQTAGSEPGWLAGQPVAAFENQGLNGFLGRLMVPTYVAEPLFPNPARFDVVYRSLAIPLVLVSAWIAARARHAYVALGIILCLALLVTPISWFHTFGTLYLILVALLKDVVDGRGRPALWAAIFCLVLFFHGATANIGSMLDPTNYRTGLRSLVLSLPFFWLLATWALLLVSAASNSRKEALG